MNREEIVALVERALTENASEVEDYGSDGEASPGELAGTDLVRGIACVIDGNRGADGASVREKAVRASVDAKMWRTIAAVAAACAHSEEQASRQIAASESA